MDYFKKLSNSNNYILMVILKNLFFSKQTKEMSLRARGSLTLEAALIFPIFTYFIVSILFFFRVIEVQLSLEKAMDFATRQGASITTEIGQNRGVIYAEATAFRMVSEDEKKTSYPMWPGIVIVPVADKDDLTLSATYMMRLPLPFIGDKNLPVNQKVTARKWIGYSGGTGKSENVDDTIVYVTYDSEVYHTTTECTHIKLSVSQVSGENLSNARSMNGGKYTKCQICKPPQGLATYYISKEGDRYHMSTSCSGLKRAYYTKLLSEVRGILRPCSRCGG